MAKEGKTAVDTQTVQKQAQKRFTDIAADLFNIEVNTILRDNITAQKMPNARHALIDIGKMYKKALAQMEAAYGKSADGVARSGVIRTTKSAPEMLMHSVGDCYGSFNGFSGLREWASRLLNDVRTGKIQLTPNQTAVLPRIKDNSDLLKGMFINIVRANPNSPDWALLTNNYSRTELNGMTVIPALPLNEPQLVLIRKIWELGTEIIVMQTIVQVDGDVITRLNPSYLDSAQYEKIRDYHNKGIEIALEHWAGLVTVAKELIATTIEGIASLLK